MKKVILIEINIASDSMFVIMSCFQNIQCYRHENKSMIRLQHTHYCWQPI